MIQYQKLIFDIFYKKIMKSHKPSNLCIKIKDKQQMIIFLLINRQLWIIFAKNFKSFTNSKGF